MGPLPTPINKSLPSQPAWYSLTPDFGFWDGDRNELLKLMAFYQKNAIVHGAIDINAKGITAAKPTLMKIVNSGAKNLSARGLKRLATKRFKRLLQQWDEPTLSRKSLGDEQELVEVIDHPLLDALHSNDEDQTFHSLLRLIVVNVCIYGIAFVEKVRDPMGRVTSYRYLPTWNVSPQRSEDGRVSGWYYSSSFGDSFNEQQPIDKADMLVIRWPSISDPHAGGDSPLKSALRKLQASGKWADYLDTVIGNRARPDWYFIPKGEGVSREEADRITKKIGDKFRGPGNGLPAIGEMPGSLVPLNWAPTDLAPLQFDEALKDAILFALSIPSAFFDNDSNRATMDASLEQWARQSLSPIVALLESALNSEAKLYGDNLVWVFENVIPEDRTQELAEQTQASQTNIQLAAEGRTAGDLTKNEHRALLGLMPLEDGTGDDLITPDQTALALPTDEIDPNGDGLQTTQATVLNGIQIESATQIVSQVVAGTLPRDSGIGMLTILFNLSAEQADEIMGSAGTSTATTPNPIPAGASGINEINQQVSDGVVSRAAAISIVAKLYGLPEAEAKKLVSHRKSRTLPPVKLLPQATSKLADKIGSQVAKQMSHYIDQLSGKKSMGLPDSFTRDIDWDEEDAKLYEPYVHMQASDTADGRVKAFTEIGADEGKFKVVPANIDEAVAKSTLKFAKSTNETTEKNLNDALDQLRKDIKAGVVNGDPIPLMKSKVEAIFENMSSERAEVIARTEISRAAHEGQRITAKASGLVKGFKLLASSECCDECAEIDGKEIGMDDKFNDEDDYDDSMLPIHPNCRCTTQEIIDFDKLGED